MKYAIPFLILSLVAVTAYALSIEQDPNILIEKENREKILKCLDDVYSETGSTDMIRKIKFCESLPLLKITWTHSTGSTVPPPNKTVSLECEWWEIQKVEWIEFHFTATDEETTLQAIKNAHVNKGSEHIGYHYVIKPDGEITNTRDEKCVAAADKWHKNNYRFIQVAFVWDDKPTDKQYDSILKLTIMLQKKYNLPIDSVSAHNEWWPKNKKESLDYWYGSKEDFIKLIRSKYQISIYWKQNEELTYMWQAWWDLAFIWTIFQESRMKNDSVGDGGNSIWYCQIHKELQPWWYTHYKALETMQERLNYCHELYTYAKWLKGGVGSRFHWYDAKEKHIKNISIY